MGIVFSHAFAAGLYYFRSLTRPAEQNVQHPLLEVNENKHDPADNDNDDSQSWSGYMFGAVSETPVPLTEALMPVLDAGDLDELREAIKLTFSRIIISTSLIKVFLRDPLTGNLVDENSQSVPTSQFISDILQQRGKTFQTVAANQDGIGELLGCHHIHENNNSVLLLPIPERGTQICIGLIVVVLQAGSASNVHPNKLELCLKQISVTYELVKVNHNKNSEPDLSKVLSLIQLCGELNDQDAAKLEIKVVRYLQEHTNSESGFLLLVVPETQMLFCQAVGNTVLQEEIRFAGPSSCFSQALESKQPMTLADIPPDRRHEVEKIMRREIHSLLCVPVCLIDSKDLLALTCMVNKCNGEEFNQADIDTIFQCFKYTGTVLTSTLAFQNERKLKNQTQALLQVAKKLFTRLGASVEKTMQHVADEVSAHSGLKTNDTGVSECDMSHRNRDLSLRQHHMNRAQKTWPQHSSQENSKNSVSAAAGEPFLCQNENENQCLWSLSSSAANISSSQDIANKAFVMVPLSVLNCGQHGNSSTCGLNLGKQPGGDLCSKTNFPPRPAIPRDTHLMSVTQGNDSDSSEGYLTPGASPSEQLLVGSLNDESMSHPQTGSVKTTPGFGEDEVSLTNIPNNSDLPRKMRMSKKEMGMCGNRLPGTFTGSLDVTSGNTYRKLGDSVPMMNLTVDASKPAETFADISDQARRITEDPRITRHSTNSTMSADVFRKLEFMKVFFENLDEFACVFDVVEQSCGSQMTGGVHRKDVACENMWNAVATAEFFHNISLVNEKENLATDDRHFENVPELWTSTKFPDMGSSNCQSRTDRDKQSKVCISNCQCRNERKKQSNDQSNKCLPNCQCRSERDKQSNDMLDVCSSSYQSGTERKKQSTNLPNMHSSNCQSRTQRDNISNNTASYCSHSKLDVHWEAKQGVSMMVSRRSSPPTSSSKDSHHIVHSEKYPAYLDVQSCGWRDKNIIDLRNHENPESRYGSNVAENPSRGLADVDSTDWADVSASNLVGQGRNHEGCYYDIDLTQAQAVGAESDRTGDYHDSDTRENPVMKSIFDRAQDYHDTQTENHDTDTQRNHIIDSVSNRTGDYHDSDTRENPVMKSISDTAGDYHDTDQPENHDTDTQRNHIIDSVSNRTGDHHDSDTRENPVMKSTSDTAGDYHDTDQPENHDTDTQRNHIIDSVSNRTGDHHETDQPEYYDIDSESETDSFQSFFDDVDDNDGGSGCDCGGSDDEDVWVEASQSSPHLFFWDMTSETNWQEIELYVADTSEKHRDILVDTFTKSAVEDIACSSTDNADGFLEENRDTVSYATKVDDAKPVLAPSVMKVDVAHPVKATTVMKVDIANSVKTLCTINEDVTNPDQAPSVKDEDVTNPNKAPSVKDEDVTNSNKAPSVMDEDVTHPDKAPSVKDEDVTHPDKAPSVMDEDVTHPDKAPSVMDEDVTHPDKAPSVMDEDVTHPDKAPSVMDEDVTHPDKAPSVMDEDVTHPDKAPSVKDEDVTNPDNAPSVKDEDVINPDNAPSVKEEDVINPDNAPSVKEDVINLDNAPSVKEEYVINPDNAPSVKEYVINPDNAPSVKEDVINPDNAPSVKEDVINPDNAPSVKEDVINPDNAPSVKEDVINPDNAPSVKEVINPDNALSVKEEDVINPDNAPSVKEEDFINPDNAPSVKEEDDLCAMEVDITNPVKTTCDMMVDVTNPVIAPPAMEEDVTNLVTETPAMDVDVANTVLAPTSASYSVEKLSTLSVFSLESSNMTCASPDTDKPNNTSTVLTSDLHIVSDRDVMTSAHEMAQKYASSNVRFSLAAVSVKDPVDYDSKIDRKIMDSGLCEMVKRVVHDHHYTDLEVDRQCCDESRVVRFDSSNLCSKVGSEANHFDYISTEVQNIENNDNSSMIPEHVSQQNRENQSSCAVTGHGENHPLFLGHQTCHVLNKDDLPVLQEVPENTPLEHQNPACIWEYKNSSCANMQLHPHWKQSGGAAEIHPETCYSLFSFAEMELGKIVAAASSTDPECSYCTSPSTSEYNMCEGNNDQMLADCQISDSCEPPENESFDVELSASTCDVTVHSDSQQISMPEDDTVQIVEFQDTEDNFNAYDQVTYTNTVIEHSSTYILRTSDQEQHSSTDQPALKSNKYSNFASNIYCEEISNQDTSNDSFKLCSSFLSALNMPEDNDTENSAVLHAADFVNQVCVSGDSSGCDSKGLYDGSDGAMLGSDEDSKVAEHDRDGDFLAGDLTRVGHSEGAEHVSDVDILCSDVDSKLAEHDSDVDILCSDVDSKMAEHDSDVAILCSDVDSKMAEHDSDVDILCSDLDNKVAEHDRDGDFLAGDLTRVGLSEGAEQVRDVAFLCSDVDSKRAEHDSDVAFLCSDVDSKRAEHDSDVDILCSGVDSKRAEHDSDVDILCSVVDSTRVEQDSDVAFLCSDMDSKVAEHDTDVAFLCSGVDSKVAEHDSDVDILPLDVDSKVVEHDSDVNIIGIDVDSKVAEHDSDVDILPLDVDSKVAEHDSDVDILPLDVDSKVAEHDSDVDILLIDVDSKVAEHDSDVDILPLDVDSKVAEHDNDVDVLFGDVTRGPREVTGDNSDVDVLSRDETDHCCEVTDNNNDVDMFSSNSHSEVTDNNSDNHILDSDVANEHDSDVDVLGGDVTDHHREVTGNNSDVDILSSDHLRDVKGIDSDVANEHDSDVDVLGGDVTDHHREVTGNNSDVDVLSSDHLRDVMDINSDVANDYNIDVAVDHDSNVAKGCSGNKARDQKESESCDLKIEHHLDNHVKDNELQKRLNDSDLQSWHHSDNHLENRDLQSRYLPDNHLDDHFNGNDLQNMFPDNQLKYDQLENCDLQNMHLPCNRFDDTDLQTSHFPGNHLDNNDLENNHFPGNHLDDNHLQTSHFPGSHLDDNHLQNSHFPCNHLDDNHLQTSHFPGNHLYDNDLQNSHFSDSHFKDISEPASLESSTVCLANVLNTDCTSRHVVNQKNHGNDPSGVCNNQPDIHVINLSNDERDLQDSPDICMIETDRCSLLEVSSICVCTTEAQYRDIVDLHMNSHTEENKSHVECSHVSDLGKMCTSDMMENHDCVRDLGKMCTSDMMENHDCVGDLVEMCTNDMIENHDSVSDLGEICTNNVMKNLDCVSDLVEMCTSEVIENHDCVNNLGEMCTNDMIENHDSVSDLGEMCTSKVMENHDYQVPNVCECGLACVDLNLLAQTDSCGVSLNHTGPRTTVAEGDVVDGHARNETINDVSDVKDVHGNSLTYVGYGGRLQVNTSDLNKYVSELNVEGGQGNIMTEALIDGHIIDVEGGQGNIMTEDLIDGHIIDVEGGQGNIMTEDLIDGHIIDVEGGQGNIMTEDLIDGHIIDVEGGQGNIMTEALIDGHIIDVEGGHGNIMTEDLIDGHIIDVEGGQGNIMTEALIDGHIIDVEGGHGNIMTEALIDGHIIDVEGGHGNIMTEALIDGHIIDVEGGQGNIMTEDLFDGHIIDVEGGQGNIMTDDLIDGHIMNVGGNQGRISDYQIIEVKDVQGINMTDLGDDQIIDVDGIQGNDNDDQLIYLENVQGRNSDDQIIHLHGVQVSILTENLVDKEIIGFVDVQGSNATEKYCVDQIIDSSIDVEDVQGSNVTEEHSGDQIIDSSIDVEDVQGSNVTEEHSGDQVIDSSIDVEDVQGSNVTEEHDDDLVIEDDDTADLLKEEDNTADLVLEDLTADLVIEEDDTADLVIEEDDTADLLKEEDDTADLVSEEDDTADLVTEEDDTADLVSEEDDTADLLKEEDNTADLVLEDLTADLVIEEDDTADLVIEEDDTADLVIEEDDTADLVSEEDNPADLVLEDLTADLVIDEDDTADLLKEEDDTVDLVIEEDDTARLVIGEDDTADLVTEDDDTAGLVIEGDNTAGLIVEENHCGDLAVDVNDDDTPNFVTEDDDTAGLVIEENHSGGQMADHRLDVRCYNGGQMVDGTLDVEDVSCIKVPEGHHGHHQIEQCSSFDYVMDMEDTSARESRSDNLIVDCNIDIHDAHGRNMEEDMESDVVLACNIDVEVNWNSHLVIDYSVDVEDIYYGIAVDCRGCRQDVHCHDVVDAHREELTSVEVNFANSDPVEVNFSVSDPVEMDFAISDPVEVNFAISDPFEVNFAVNDPVEVNFAVSDPVEEDFAVSDPVGVDFAVSDSVEVNFAVSDPVGVDFAVSDPVEVDFAVSDPVKVDLAVGDPVKVDFAVGDPVKVDFAVDDPVKVDLAVGDPVKVDFAVDDPVEVNFAAGDPFGGPLADHVQTDEAYLINARDADVPGYACEGVEEIDGTFTENCGGLTDDHDSDVIQGYDNDITSAAEETKIDSLQDYSTERIDNSNFTCLLEVTSTDSLQDDSTVIIDNITGLTEEVRIGSLQGDKSHRIDNISGLTEEVRIDVLQDDSTDWIDNIIGLLEATSTESLQDDIRDVLNDNIDYLRDHQSSHEHLETGEEIYTILGTSHSKYAAAEILTAFNESYMKEDNYIPVPVGSSDECETAQCLQDVTGKMKIYGNSLYSEICTDIHDAGSQTTSLQDLCLREAADETQKTENGINAKTLGAAGIDTGSYMDELPVLATECILRDDSETTVVEGEEANRPRRSSTSDKDSDLARSGSSSTDTTYFVESSMSSEDGAWDADISSFDSSCHAPESSSRTRVREPLKYHILAMRRKMVRSQCDAAGVQSAFKLTDDSKSGFYASAEVNANDEDDDKVTSTANKTNKMDCNEKSVNLVVGIECSVKWTDLSLRENVSVDANTCKMNVEADRGDSSLFQVDKCSTFCSVQGGVGRFLSDSLPLMTEYPLTTARENSVVLSYFDSSQTREDHLEQDILNHCNPSQRECYLEQNQRESYFEQDILTHYNSSQSEGQLDQDILTHCNSSQRSERNLQQNIMTCCYPNQRESYFEQDILTHCNSGQRRECYLEQDILSSAVVRQECIEQVECHSVEITDECMMLPSGFSTDTCVHLADTRLENIGPNVEFQQHSLAVTESFQIQNDCQPFCTNNLDNAFSEHFASETLNSGLSALESELLHVRPVCKIIMDENSLNSTSSEAHLQCLDAFQASLIASEDSSAWSSSKENVEALNSTEVFSSEASCMGHVMMKHYSCDTAGAIIDEEHTYFEKYASEAYLRRPENINGRHMVSLNVDVTKQLTDVSIPDIEEEDTRSQEFQESYKRTVTSTCLNNKHTNDVESKGNQSIEFVELETDTSVLAPLEISYEPFLTRSSPLRSSSTNKSMLSVIIEESEESSEIQDLADVDPHSSGCTEESLNTEILSSNNYDLSVVYQQGSFDAGVMGETFEVYNGLDEETSYTDNSRNVVHTNSPSSVGHGISVAHSTCVEEVLREGNEDTLDHLESKDRFSQNKYSTCEIVNFSTHPDCPGMQSFILTPQARNDRNLRQLPTLKSAVAIEENFGTHETDQEIKYQETEYLDATDGLEADQSLIESYLCLQGQGRFPSGSTSADTGNFYQDRINSYSNLPTGRQISVKISTPKDPFAYPELESEAVLDTLRRPENSARCEDYFIDEKHLEVDEKYIEAETVVPQAEQHFVEKHIPGVIGSYFQSYHGTDCRYLPEVSVTDLEPSCLVYHGYSTSIEGKLDRVGARSSHVPTKKNDNDPDHGDNGRTDVSVNAVGQISAGGKDSLVVEEKKLLDYLKGLDVRLLSCKDDGCERNYFGDEENKSVINGGGDDNNEDDLNASSEAYSDDMERLGSSDELLGGEDSGESYSDPDILNHTSSTINDISVLQGLIGHTSFDLQQEFNFKTDSYSCESSNGTGTLMSRVNSRRICLTGSPVVPVLGPLIATNKYDKDELSSICHSPQFHESYLEGVESCDVRFDSSALFDGNLHPLTNDHRQSIEIGKKCGYNVRFSDNGCVEVCGEEHLGKHNDGYDSEKMVGLYTKEDNENENERNKGDDFSSMDSKNRFDDDRKLESEDGSQKMSASFDGGLQIKQLDVLTENGNLKIVNDSDGDDSSLGLQMEHLDIIVDLYTNGNSVSVKEDDDGCLGLLGESDLCGCNDLEMEHLDIIVNLNKNGNSKIDSEDDDSSLGLIGESDLCDSYDLQREHLVNLNKNGNSKIDGEDDNSSFGLLGESDLCDSDDLFAVSSLSGSEVNISRMSSDTFVTSSSLPVVTDSAITNQLSGYKERYHSFFIGNCEPDSSFNPILQYCREWSLYVNERKATDEVHPDEEQSSEELDKQILLDSDADHIDQFDQTYSREWSLYVSDKKDSDEAQSNEEHQFEVLDERILQDPEAVDFDQTFCRDVFNEGILVDDSDEDDVNDLELLSFHTRNRCVPEGPNRDLCERFTFCDLIQLLPLRPAYWECGLRTDDLTKLLREIMQEARNLTDAERCSVFLLDKDSDELVAMVFDGITADDKEWQYLDTVQGEIRLPKTQGIAGHVATTGTLLNIRDAYSHPLFYRGIDDSTGFRTRNILCFPIKDEEGVVFGVAQLCNKKTFQYFTTFDEDVASAFAVYCCISISHSLMYKKVIDIQYRNSLANELMMFHMKSLMYKKLVDTQYRHHLANALLLYNAKQQVPNDEVKIMAEMTIPEVTMFSPNFDSFDFPPRTIPESQTVLSCLSMFEDLGFLSRWRVKLDTLVRFLLMVKKGYRNPPYHNWMHAYAVTHFCYLLIKNLHLHNYLEDIELLALFVSCLCHDIDHRGTTNSFQVQSQSVLAALYSSEGSVMERHHLAQSMCILNTEGSNLFEGLSSKEYQIVLDLMREIILATDLAHHLRAVKDQEKMAASGQYDKNNPTDKHNLLCLLMTACDLSDQTKSWHNTKHIAALVYQEFFSQGDLEKALGKNPLEMMDRERACIPELQISFLDNIATPVYKILANMFPEADIPLKNVEDNRKHWVHIGQLLKLRHGTTTQAMSVEQIISIEEEEESVSAENQVNGR